MERPRYTITSGRERPREWRFRAHLLYSYREEGRKFLSCRSINRKKQRSALKKESNGLSTGDNMCPSCSPILSVVPHSGRCIGCALKCACVHSQVYYICSSVFALGMSVCVCVCSCALSLVRKKRPLIEFPLISRQPRLAERDACLPAAQHHTSGVVDNGG